MWDGKTGSTCLEIQLWPRELEAIVSPKDSTRMVKDLCFQTIGGHREERIVRRVGDGKVPPHFDCVQAPTGMERLTARQGGSHRAAQEIQRCRIERGGRT